MSDSPLGDGGDAKGGAALLDEGASTESIAAVKAERDYWRSLFANLVAAFPEPLVVTDDAGRITHCNDAMARLGGVSADRAVGDALSTLGDWGAVAGRAVETGRGVSPTEPRTTADDRVRRELAAPLRDGEGDLVGAFATAVDVTDPLRRHRAGADARERARTTLADALSALEGTADAMADGVEAVEAAAGETADDADAAAERASDARAAAEDVAEAAETLADRHREVSELLAEVRDAVEATDERTDRLRAAAADASEAVESVRETVEAIADVADAIADVADRTDLLARNAAIEAARAGDGSDGFGVVAEEVRSLAEDARGHADEIADLVESAREDAARASDRLGAARPDRDAGRSGDGNGTAAVEDLADRLDDAESRAEDLAAAAREARTASAETAALADDAATAAAELPVGDLSRILGRHERALDRGRRALGKLEG